MNHSVFPSRSKSLYRLHKIPDYGSRTPGCTLPEHFYRAINVQLHFNARNL